jgi:hypothetical protein
MEAVAAGAEETKTAAAAVAASYIGSCLRKQFRQNNEWLSPPGAAYYTFSSVARRQQDVD